MMEGADVAEATAASETTAERIAAVLRRRITEGELPPGTQLCEERLVTLMAVSRNTLREAFRLLTHDGLLVHHLHRGVFVPELDEDDLVDLYRLRRTIECAVVRSLTGLDADRLRALRSIAEAAEAAASRNDWGEVGTANMRFHQHLVDLGGSRRIGEVTRRLLAELRLVFHIVASPQQLYDPYVDRNRALLDMLAANDVARAADYLEQYLCDSEEQLLAAYRGRRDTAPARAMTTKGGGNR